MSPSSGYYWEYHPLDYYQEYKNLKCFQERRAVSSSARQTQNTNEIILAVEMERKM